MAANDITISDLTFEGIKSSLINYLKNQDTFKDYNFEGSAIKTLIDLLAYNTFYYGYYSNMMANEMFLDTAKLQNSLISLTKPLGYLVYDRLSSKALVKLKNTNSNYSELSTFSVFRGNDSAGRPYYFYNLKPVKIGQSGTVPGTYETGYFEIYEGAASTRRQLVNVDLNTQTFSLPDITIDPRTIIVEVGDVNGENLVEWSSYYLNPETIIGPDTEVFFTERDKGGYKINFGKYSSNDNGVLSTGKRITNQDTVYVSYLVSSGTEANNISNISFLSESEQQDILTSSTTLEISVTSRGGVSQPDLDNIRFFAPKTFSRQNRLVTKNDYYAILNELGYGSGSQPEFSYKVFGGEEANPPVYGRVFVSIIDLNPTDQSDYTTQNEINEVLSVLKSKSVVSILPEYLPPVEMNAVLTLTVSHPNATNPATTGQMKTAITTNLMAEYSPKKYDRRILKQDVEQIARNSYSGLQVSNFSLIIKAISPNSIELNGRKINFKTRLTSIQKITGFDDSYTAKNENKFIYLYDNQIKVNNIPIGEVDLDRGIITIYPNVTKNALTFEIKVPDENFVASDEIVCYVSTATDIIIINNT